VIAVWHWFLQVTGTANESGKWYGFWSGFGADLEEFGIVVIIYGVYRRNKCQSCPRLVLKGGLGKVEGTHYETCRKHTTTADHEALKEKHKKLHPEMHEHLNHQGAP
jgi:hypothetical protein